MKSAHPCDGSFSWPQATETRLEYRVSTNFFGDKMCMLYMLKLRHYEKNQTKKQENNIKK
jgi:hypothetical protein